MMKHVLLLSLFACKDFSLASATRTRARHLSVEDIDEAGKAGSPPKHVKRNKAGREIDRSFLVRTVSYPVSRHGIFADWFSHFALH